MMILKTYFPRKKYSRIISLVPSQTELLFDLGLESEVVGITKFCIHPKSWFETKTRIGGTKNLNMKAIHFLKPDLIIANKEENVKEQIEALAHDFDVWVTDVNNLGEATQMIQDIGEITHREEKAYRLQNEILKKFATLRQKTENCVKIRTAYFIWKDPYMVAGSGTFIHDLLPYCGLENSFSKELRYPQIDLKSLKANKCALILLSSEPYPFKEIHQREMEELFPGIPVLLVDGEMFSWYGSRLSKSADYFEKLYTDIIQKMQIP
jgi:ABC-type Fe3+-hydroxamate transport system substrate-binding protein